VTAARIRVTVQPGREAGERVVSFMEAREVMITVDARELDGDLLHVEVVGEDAARATVRLPAQTVMGTWTVTVLRADVLPAPPGEHTPTTAPEEDDELHALDDAWRSLLDGRDDEDEGERPLLALLLGAVVAGSYEGAEADPPVVAVLRAARATVEGWTRQHSASTRFASVAFVDLELLARRLDVALAIIKRTPGGVQ
jgi:hypothetical protein